MMAMTDSPLKKGQLVLAQGRTGTFRVLEVSKDGRTADIESSIQSKQGQLGPVLMAIPCTALAALTDDTSVAAPNLSNLLQIPEAADTEADSLVANKRRIRYTHDRG
jgi:hypothetical protein